MKEKTLKNLSYLYIILPIIVFVIGWIKLIISIPIVILLIVSYKKMFLANKEKQEVIIEKKNVYWIYGFCVIFCITAGLGNLFYQSGDWDARNAIYRDIVTKSWPVTYESKFMMVYYIGFWLVPSLAGKLVTGLVTLINKYLLHKTGFVVTTFISEIAFGISNFALLFWGAFGVLLTLIWLIKLLKLKDVNSYKKAIFIFLIFSGLDFIGLMGLKTNFCFYQIHIDPWAIDFQYSSMVTQIFWVFNQAIPIWLITLMFLGEEKVNNYMVLVISALAFTPFGAVGISPLIVGKGITFLIKDAKNKKIKSFVKDVFSFQNIVFLIAILPMYYFYYFGNSSVANASETGSFVYTIFSKKNINYIYYYLIILVLFYILEVGLFFIILLKNHKKDLLLYISAISLMFIPIFKIGYSNDFCMRASIPSLVFIDFCVVKFFFEEKKKISFRYIAMVSIVMIGFITPFIEYFRAFYCINTFKKINLVNDKAKTVVKNGKVYSTNFVTEDYENKSLFYKYYVKY